jgi:dGTP triphosphohydrolase
MSAEKGLKERVAAGERESNGLRSEVNQMAANLAQLREDLKNSEKALQKTVADSVKALSAAKGEKQKLQSLLEGANSSLENNGMRASGDIAAMAKRIENIEAEAASGMRVIKDAHICAMHALREQQNAALDAERIVLENFKAVSLLKETQLQVGPCSWYM